MTTDNLPPGVTPEMCEPEGEDLSEMPNPNENVLKGKMCPKCGAFDEFNVMCSTLYTFSDDGEVDHDELSFDHNSYAECCVCHHHGNWSDFDDKRKL